MENTEHLDRLLALAEPPRENIEERERLEQVLDALVRAQAAWPALRVPVDELIAHANSVLAPASGDLELDYLKATYRAEFGAAFSTALQALSARERNLLAQHYVDRLSIDEMGVIYGSHRATIARWLARARETLLQQTRALLMERIQVNRAEHESIMRLIESQLPATIAGGEE